jgi:hypothetical protein
MTTLAITVALSSRNFFGCVFAAILLPIIVEMFRDLRLKAISTPA